MAGTSSAAPAAANVFAYSDRQIEQAAAMLWPGAVVRLGVHTPSVTAYVRRVQVDGRALFAKVSLLGLSLVSVLRGTAGDWAQVRAAQVAYQGSPGTLLEREARGLDILREEAGVPACRVAGHQNGVLFTEQVTGPTLADLLAKDPQRTGELMTRAVVELTGLQRPAVARKVDEAAITERGIGSTFDRKFNGISGPTYLRKAGQAGDMLSTLVLRLRRLRPTPAAGHRPVVYGDLKPDHVVFPDGADGRPVFLDPGLGRGRPQADPAKLISRTVLGLIASAPDLVTADATARGIEEFTDALTADLAPGERAEWLRHLVVLWLMDTTNILSTYLTSPPDLPLPEHAGKLTARTERVCGLLETTSAGLAAGTGPRAVWQLALAGVVKATNR
ncbi:phosphotransferase [Streptomyces sp. CA-181903]|uniref:phosphotransferase n=1 Tax=Streptomyces sp. CA-181903 TaxID=3240055 RepID=UPI003D8FA6C6